MSLKLKLALVPALALTLFAGLKASALDVGSTAPCVVLTDVQPDGSQIEQCIRTRKPGQEFALIEFFSAVCEDCRTNLPIVSELARDIEPTTTVRLVGLDRDEALLRKYITDHSDLIRFPVSLDLHRDAKKAYGVVSTPTLFLLDAKHKVVFKHEGVLSPADVERIKELVTK